MQIIRRGMPILRDKVIRVGALYFRFLGAFGFRVRSIFIDVSEFDVLRYQYAFYYNPIVRRIKNKLRVPVKRLVYKIDIIDGSRVSVHWGNGDVQVLGKSAINATNNSCGAIQKVIHQEDNSCKIDEVETSTIKVLTLCTFAHGGAGTGSIRRVEALRSIGVDAKLVSLLSKRENNYIGRVIPALDALNIENQELIWTYINSNIRNKIDMGMGYCGQEFFSTDVSVLKFVQLKELVDEVDIVHLHWVVGMLDYSTMSGPLRDKPVVWTTADMNPFTGGCHYSEGCEGFVYECSSCPMVDKSNNAPHLLWKQKKNAYKDLDITLVCPSEHIARLARKSSLLGDKPIHVIANAYPVDIIHPQDRAVSIDKYGLSSNKKYVLFAAESLSNLRKGADLINKVARRLKKYDVNDTIEFVTIGKSEIHLPYKVHNLGSVDQKHLSYVYSAANVFVSLSREDVGPMTVVESLLCGTPVVGFNIGVIPDVVQQGITGLAVEPFSIDGIVDGILFFLGQGENKNVIAEKCRISARQYADPEQSAMRHKKLYTSLMNNNIISERIDSFN